MTSGNLAVFDHDVRRHLDFLGRLGGRADGLRARHRGRAGERVEEFLAAKRPGDVDIAEVRTSSG